MSDSRSRDDKHRSSHKDSPSSNRSREDRERERLARRSGNEDSSARNRDGDSGRSRDLDQDRDRDRDRRRDRERERSPRGSRDGERDRRRDQDRVRDRERDRQIFSSSSSSSRNREDPKNSISAHQSTSRINKEPLDMNLDYGRPDDELESSRNRNSDKARISSSNHRSERNDDARERNRRDDRYRDDRSGRGVKFDDRSLPPSTDSTKSRSRIEVLESQSKSMNGSAPNGPSKDSRSNPSVAAPPQAKSNSASTSSSSKSILKRSPTPDIDYEMEMMSKEEREEKLLEERRKKRKEILEKYNKEEEKKEESKESVSQQSTATTINNNSNSKFSLEKSNQDPKSTGNQVPNPSELQISAADYDPSKDMESDAKREEKKLGHNHFETQGSGSENGKGKSKVEEDDDDEWEEIEVEEDEDDVEDMFALDDDDDNNGEEKKKKTKIIRVRKGEKRDVDDKKSKSLKAQAAPAHGLSDNWDDSDGYYRVTLGERMGEGGRYQVSSILGRGMFSEVVRAKDTRSLDYNKEVAIKIVRIQESMYKAGLKEISILKKLRELDPNDKKHVINLENSFDFKGHLCLVFENLNMNLRELIKRFGKDVGINLRAVRTYCHQMFLALSLLKKGNFMHADIKPDNILVDESKTTLKVCDLGSASHVDEMEITPYLVSRFYRAPEIILGAPYDPSLDVWSIGCTLYELFTGKILFPGRSNNQMLLLMQELKGKITNKQLRKSKFSKQHFDEETNVFLSRERDRNTGADVIRKIAISKPTSDLRSRILPPETQKTLSEEDLRLTLNFIDLLNKTLELDPNKRITPNAALSHPFCTG